MATVKSTWAIHQEGLLGRLAAAKEELTDIAEDADLEEIEGAIDALQEAISDSNEAKMAEDAEEDEEDEGEEEEEEDEEEE